MLRPLLVLALIGFSAHAERFHTKPSAREVQRAVRDSRNLLPKMERILCLLQGKCPNPGIEPDEKEVAEAGERFRRNSQGHGKQNGLTFDLPLPRMLNYLSPGTGVRVRAVNGTIAQLTFFREPLSRRGVVIFSTETRPTEPLDNPTELQPSWWFGYQK